MLMIAATIFCSCEKSNKVNCEISCECGDRPASDGNEDNNVAADNSVFSTSAPHIAKTTTMQFLGNLNTAIIQRASIKGQTALSMAKKTGGENWPHTMCTIGHLENGGGSRRQH